MSDGMHSQICIQTSLLHPNNGEVKGHMHIKQLIPGTVLVAAIKSWVGPGNEARLVMWNGLWNSCVEVSVNRSFEPRLTREKAKPEDSHGTILH